MKKLITDYHSISSNLDFFHIKGAPGAINTNDILLVVLRNSALIYGNGLIFQKVVQFGNGTAMCLCIILWCEPIYERELG